ncbi:phosphomevalonate kinase [Hydra vulgaris]|uniref:phosphomevalonate kinase n=1 Tax=Hydra vulgaris TaxID=6087 RepID=UPI00019271E7|nr:phosphomevalonate kinase [Hydra vulgaris]
MVNSNKVIIVLSGKRKSGKDYIADKIFNKIGNDTCVQIKLANPIKMHFSKKFGLNFEELITSSPYKEEVRKEMILWGNEQRLTDPFVFCKMITNDAVSSRKNVWILTDARLRTDVEYFKKYAIKNNFHFICLRVVADVPTRQLRGWTFVEGVDDISSECGLDDYSDWDFVFLNSSGDNIEHNIESFCSKVKALLLKE